MESESGELQFDRAEYAGQGSNAQSCTSCKRPIGDSYFEMLGRVICEVCKNRLHTILMSGSGSSRFSRAIGAGLLAAALGAGIYFGVSVITGYELGLIAIVVGYLVGKAVAWGSNYRGGLSYQLLAMFLTYSAIVSTYIPKILNAYDGAVVVQSSQSAADGESLSFTQEYTVEDQSFEIGERVKFEEEPVRLTDHVFGWVFLIVLAFLLPFLGGLQNIMGIIIIGIALYEAWQFNKRNPIKFTGPFSVRTGRVSLRPGIPS